MRGELTSSGCCQARRWPPFLAGYAEVARRTDELVASLPSLNAGHPLPKAPWFPPGESWSAPRVFLHIIAETAHTPATPTSSANPWTAPSHRANPGNRRNARETCPVRDHRVRLEPPVR